MSTEKFERQALQAEDSPMDSNSLGHGLKTRHLTMMGLGSAIGAGLFLGTGVGINAAGPAVLLSYLIAGIVVIFVMQMLGELAAARPSSGSFAHYANQAFGPWAGFTIGWLYWFMLVMVMGAEITGAGAFMGAWFGVPGWIPGLIAVIFFSIVNLAAVRGFGEFEYWFAMVKIVVIAFFLIIGVLLITGLLPGHEARGFSNLTPFAPYGISGVATGLLAVAFAFGGIEIITIAAAESEKPAESIASAVRAVIWRISIFYLGSVFVITTLLDSESISSSKNVAASPFTQVLMMANLPAVVGFMEIIIVLALLSAFNAQIYATSRLMFASAQEGNAPAIFTRLSSHNVPVPAVLSSLFFAFFSVAMQVWGPENLIAILFNAVGGSLLVIWFVIAVTQLKLRKELEEEGSLKVKTWFFPWTTIITLLALLGLTILMLTDDSARSQVVTVVIVTAILSILGVINQKMRSQK